MTAAARGRWRLLDSRLRRNLATNFLSQAWAVILGVGFVPVFLRLLGAEGYGLIGFATSLQAVMGVLDLGLGTAANREFSRAGALKSSSSQLRTLLRTLEVPYFATAALIALVLLPVSPYLAHHWVQADAIPADTVRRCLMLLGLTIALRWPVGLYSGVLRGLEHQVALNVLVIAASTLRTAGLALLLIAVQGGVMTYFLGLLLVGCLEVFTIALFAWRRIPRTAGQSGRFDPVLFRALWSFSGQVTLISLFATVLKQMDKVVISKLQPLSSLGYYSIAVTLSGGLSLVAAPVFGAVFPRLSALLTHGEERAAGRLYHRAARLVALLGSPAALALVFFANPILLLWTRSPEVAAQASAALSALAVAMLLNSFMQVPYALQLAAGLTRIPLWTNGIGVLILAPALVLLVQEYGILGGGLTWALFNLAYVAVIPYVMHRSVLRGQLTAWLLHDTLPFTILATLCYGGAAWLFHLQSPPLGAYFFLAFATAAYSGIVLMTWGRSVVRFGTSSDVRVAG
jgi:O-antigen/teichoic acid export membrane protein